MKSLLSLERFEGLSVFGIKINFEGIMFYLWCIKLLRMYMS